MAKDPDEIANDSDTQDVDEEEDTTDEDDDAAEGDDDRSSDDSDAEDDDDDDSSDSTDDAPIPKTRKEFDDAIAKAVRKGIAASRNREGADRRTSKKGRDLPGPRPKVEDRVANLEKITANAEAAESKRQFGYDNELSPAEVDIVFRFNPKPTAKTLRDPAVKGAIDGFREAKRSRNNMPSPNARTYGSKGRSYQDLKTPDKEKHFVERRREIIAAKRDQ